MKFVLAASAAAVLALAVPAAASAAAVSVDPAKACYRDGETVSLLGSAFTPLSSVNVTKDGSSLGSLAVDANGGFNGELRLAQRSGQRTSTYVATDPGNPALTASTAIVVSALGVRLRPKRGAPSRIFKIGARGFTTGRTLWAHVRRSGGGYSDRIKLGRLEGPCHKRKVRQRLLPRGARTGLYTIQFDTYKTYKERREVSVGYSLNVYRTFRPRAASGPALARIF